MRGGGGRIKVGRCAVMRQKCADANRSPHQNRPASVRRSQVAAADCQEAGVPLPPDSHLSSSRAAACQRASPSQELQPLGDQSHFDITRCQRKFKLYDEL